MREKTYTFGHVIGAVAGIVFLFLPILHFTGNLSFTGERTLLGFVVFCSTMFGYGAWFVLASIGFVKICKVKIKVPSRSQRNEELELLGEIGRASVAKDEELVELKLKELDEIRKHK